MSGLNVRRLTLLVWLLGGHCRRAGYSAAAQPGLRQLQRDGHAAAAGDRAGDLYRRRLLAPSVVTIWGALLGAILVNALSNGLGLLGVNIFWMGAIKGGLILVVLAASAVRHKGGEA
ncbi:transmembrane sugar transport protein [Klebsiella pneumoniae]|uniref:Transmembrane sugar transport protein n=1 Tax=Klebsiella pneumoniae TaxID=573 RepID=A0A378F8P6_KLEPN|nr:transmembrane sugar transport protein [Klebsiella pneumoniae]